jgi:hypothetical protein
MVEIEALDYSDCMYPSNNWFFLEVGYYYLETVFPSKMPPDLLPPKPILIIPHLHPTTKYSWEKEVGRRWALAGRAFEGIRIIVDPPAQYQSQRFFEKHYQYEYILVIDSTRLTRIKRKVSLILSCYYEWLDLQENAIQLVPFISLDMILWELFGHEFLHFALKHLGTRNITKLIHEQREVEVDRAFYHYLLPPKTYSKPQPQIQIYEFLKWFYDERSSWFE